MKEATAICVTHGHIGHIGDSFQLVCQTGAKLICTPELGFYADSKGLREYQINIEFDSESLRQKWARPKEHTEIWPKVVSLCQGISWDGFDTVTE